MVGSTIGPLIFGFPIWVRIQASMFSSPPLSTSTVPGPTWYALRAVKVWPKAARGTHAQGQMTHKMEPYTNFVLFLRRIWTLNSLQTHVVLKAVRASVMIYLFSQGVRNW